MSEYIYISRWIHVPSLLCMAPNPALPAIHLPKHGVWLASCNTVSLSVCLSVCISVESCDHNINVFYIVPCVLPSESGPSNHRARTVPDQDVR